MSKERNDRFTVQGFQAKGKGLQPDLPQSARDEPHALLMGERLARSRVGVVVLRQSGDPEFGELDEPVVLARYGRVPPIYGDLPF